MIRVRGRVSEPLAVQTEAVAFSSSVSRLFRILSQYRFESLEHLRFFLFFLQVSPKALPQTERVCELLRAAYHPVFMMLKRLLNRLLV